MTRRQENDDGKKVNSSCVKSYYTGEEETWSGGGSGLQGEFFRRYKA